MNCSWQYENNITWWFLTTSIAHPWSKSPTSLAWLTAVTAYYSDVASTLANNIEPEKNKSDHAQKHATSLLKPSSLSSLLINGLTYRIRFLFPLWFATLPLPITYKTHWLPYGFSKWPACSWFRASVLSLLSFWKYFPAVCMACSSFPVGSLFEGHFISVALSRYPIRNGDPLSTHKPAFPYSLSGLSFSIVFIPI